VVIKGFRQKAAPIRSSKAFETSDFLRVLAGVWAERYSVNAVVPPTGQFVPALVVFGLRRAQSRRLFDVFHAWGNCGDHRSVDLRFHNRVAALGH
jgi:hypothetical protein